VTAGFVALLLCAALSGARAPAPGPITRVAVEVFTVGLAAGERDALVFARREGELQGGVNPDDRARDLSAGEIALIHSTSWRWEPDGRIVLTYVAWAREAGSIAGARPLPALAPAGPTDPLHPRPAEIRELDPLAHGLRHLAFLLRTSRDGALAAAVGSRAARALTRLDPDVAGELPPPR
jgi:hypothetical protein